MEKLSVEKIRELVIVYLNETGVSEIELMVMVDKDIVAFERMVGFVAGVAVALHGTVEVIPDELDFGDILGGESK